MAKKTYVAAIDGAPGIMPGIMTFETLVEFEDDEPTSAQYGGESPFPCTNGGGCRATKKTRTSLYLYFKAEP